MLLRMNKRQEGKLNESGSLKGTQQEFIQFFMGTTFWGYTFLVYNAKGYDGRFHRIVCVGRDLLKAIYSGPPATSRNIFD